MNAGDVGKALGLFQGDLENRTDIKRMGMESLEVKAFKRLVLDGLDSDGIVLEGRGGDKAPFTDKSEGRQKTGGYRVYLEAVAGSSLKKGEVTEESETLWLRQVLELFGQFQLLAVVRKGPFGVEGLN